MERLSFEVQARELSGSSANNRYRKAGLLPAVIYAHGEKSISSLIAAREFVQMAKSARTSQVFTLTSKDKGIDGRIVIVKEIQKDPLNGSVLHVDLQSLKENEAITIRIPLVIKGEAVGVKLNGGILTVLFHDVGVRCLPRAIPESIEIDISHLDVGDSMHARDVKLPEGVSLADNSDETIVSVVIPRAVEEEKPATDEAAAAAEGAAAAPAEGGAPAAQGAAPAAGAAKKEGGK